MNWCKQAGFVHYFIVLKPASCQTWTNSTLSIILFHTWAVASLYMYWASLYAYKQRHKLDSLLHLIWEEKKTCVHGSRGDDARWKLAGDHWLKGQNHHGEEGRRGADSGLGWPVTPSEKDCHITWALIWNFDEQNEGRNIFLGAEKNKKKVAKRRIWSAEF